MIITQNVPPVTVYFAQPVAISIYIKCPRKNADIDNRIKPVVDFLVFAGVIEDDKSEHVRRVSAEWADVEGCVVRVEAA